MSARDALPWERAYVPAEGAALLATLPHGGSVVARSADDPLPAWMHGNAAPDERAVAAVERATHPR